MHWVDGKLSRLESETEKFNSVAGRVFVPHCTSWLYTSKSRLPDHLLEDLERLEGMSFTDEAPLEHFNVVVRQ